MANDTIYRHRGLSAFRVAVVIAQALCKEMPTTTIVIASGPQPRPFPAPETSQTLVDQRD